jgi:hypothetical protein
MESQPAAPIKLPENASTERSNWQTRILAECRNPSLLRGLGVLHGRRGGPEKPVKRGADQSRTEGC